MKRKLFSAALFIALAASLGAVGALKIGSSGADVPPQSPEPPESVFGEHSYTVPDNFEFAPPPDDLPPPAVSREEIIAQAEANLASAQADAQVLSVDLVTIVRSPAAEPPPGRYWFVFGEGVFWSRPGGFGGPVYPDGDPCNAPPEQQPAACQPVRYRGSFYALIRPDTGSLFAYGNDEGTPCDPPAEGVEPC